MNRKTYLIWMVLLDNPNKWYGCSDLAFKVDLTYRQVLSVLIKMPDDIIEKDKESSNEMVARAVGDDHKIAVAKTKIYAEYYNVSDNDVKEVVKHLSFAGWTSVLDIASETPIDKLTVSRALSIAPCAETKTSNSSVFYRLRI